jgi:hypothetical protein
MLHCSVGLPSKRIKVPNGHKSYILCGLSVIWPWHPGRQHVTQVEPRSKDQWPARPGRWRMMQHGPDTRSTRLKHTSRSATCLAIIQPTSTPAPAARRGPQHVLSSSRGLSAVRRGCQQSKLRRSIDSGRAELRRETTSAPVRGSGGKLAWRCRRRGASAHTTSYRSIWYSEKIDQLFSRGALPCNGLGVGWLPMGRSLAHRRLPSPSKIWLEEQHGRKATIYGLPLDKNPTMFNHTRKYHQTSHQGDIVYCSFGIPPLQEDQ